jgi:phage terminase large subunit
MAEAAVNMSPRAAGFKKRQPFSGPTPIFKAYGEFLQPARFKVAYGGRGSAKTRTIVTILLNNVLHFGWRVACFRELMKSLEDSVYQEFIDEIERRGLDKFFKTIKNSIKCLNGRGGIIKFDGLHRNQSKVKGYAGFDCAWVEEAENVSEESWKYLIPTLRKRGSEIWVSFNPDDPLGATYQKFVTKRIYPDYMQDRIHILDEYGEPVIENGEEKVELVWNEDGSPALIRYCVVLKVNYTENPRFPDTLRADMELMKEADYEMYRHVYLGEPVGNSELAIIKPVWIEAAVDAHKLLGFEPTGARIGGFDVSDEGPDKNSFIGRHGQVMDICEQWRDSDPNTAARRVFMNALALGFSTVTYDNIGVGAGAKGAIREEKEKLTVKDTAPVYRGFVANAEVLNPEGQYKPGKKNKDMFLNLKAQSWWLLADRFKDTYDAVMRFRATGERPTPEQCAKLLSISSGVNNLEQLKGELSQPRREFQDGKFRVESKKDMAKRGVVSPNLADGAVMCYSPDTGFKLSALI